MMSVKTVHKNYTKYSNHIKLVRDALAGDVQNETYIKPLPNQDKEEYKAFVTRPSYDNFISRVLDGYSGLVFAKTPQKDFTNKLEAIADDIDMNDSSHVDMAQTLVDEVLTTGLVGVLVDIHTSGLTEPVNGVIADKYIRPYAKIYSAESIINYRIENNQTSLVVLRELIEVPNNEFESIEVEQFMVLSLQDGYYRTRVIRIDSEGKETTVVDKFPTQNNQKMRYIPFYAANASNITLKQSKPPLYDMANVNVSLMRLKCDLYHGLFFSAIPTPWGAGIDDDNFTFSLGAATAHTFHRADASLNYLEFSGQGLGAVKDELKEIKVDLGRLGAEFLRDSTNSAEASETVAMRTSADRATLISVADTISRLLTLVFKEMARWYGDNDAQISYKLNTDYSLTQSNPQMLTSIMQLHATNAISDYDLFTILKKGEMIDDALTFNEWQEYRQNSSMKI